MNNNVTRKEVAEQYAIAVQLLLDWLDLSENSTKRGSNKIIDKHFSTL